MTSSADRGAWVRPLRRSATALLVVSTTCGDSSAVRLTVRADTIAINGPAPALLGVTPVTRSGKTLSARRVQYAVSHDSAVELQGTGVVRCKKGGDAVVTARLHQLSAEVVVHCRPISSYAFPIGRSLTLGEPPQPLVVTAFDSSGRRITELSGVATVVDTSIVRLVNGMLYPEQVGRTEVRIDFGGIPFRQVLDVNQVAVRDSLRLVGGEYRSWSLPAGRTMTTLASVDGRHGADELRLGAVNANCALRRADAPIQRLYCVSQGKGQVIVRNMARHERSLQAAKFEILIIPK